VKINQPKSILTGFLLRFVGLQFVAFVLAIILIVFGYTLVTRTYVRFQASQVMDVMLAVREYTSRKINPLIAPINASSEEAFMPEAVPSYSATKVFEYLRLNNAYADFQYREASLNPTSPSDRAKANEEEIISRFENNPRLREVNGIVTDNSDHSQYFLAKPIRLSKESCLTCHSTPDRAPKSQLIAYGDKNGFGWKLGDVVGVQIVSLPIDSGLPSPARFVLLLVLAVGLMSLIVVVVGKRFFESFIARPLMQVLHLASNESYESDDYSKNLRKRSDEFGTLSRWIFNLREELKRR